MNKEYQLTRKEAQSRGVIENWESFWKRVGECSRALTNQSCSPPSMKQTIHRLASRVGGMEPIACLIAGELFRRGPRDCVLDAVFNWASSEEYQNARLMSAECGLLSFTLATTAKYVMELVEMTPIQLLSEKMRVELACFSGQLPWEDHDRLMDCAGELTVKHAVSKAASRMEPEDEAAAYLLRQENALDCFYTAYLKQAPPVENLVDSVLRGCSAKRKQPLIDIWGEWHES